MPRQNQPRYVLTNHLCRHCGTGRVLQQTNSGITGGGNPVFCCASCGASAAAIGPSAICWCNHVCMRGGLPFETMCVAGDAAPEFVQSGWYRRRLHYGLSVWWRYAPDQSTQKPNFERASHMLLTGDCGYPYKQ